MGKIVDLHGKTLTGAPRTVVAFPGDPLGLTPAPKYIAVGTFDLNQEQVAAALLAYCESNFGMAVPSEQVSYDLAVQIDEDHALTSISVGFKKHVPDFGETYAWVSGDRFFIDDGTTDPVTGKIHRVMDGAVVVFLDEHPLLPPCPNTDRCATIPKTGLRPESMHQGGAA